VAARSRRLRERSQDGFLSQTFSNLNDELGFALVPNADGTYTVRPWGVALNMLTIVLGMIAIALLTAALTNSRAPAAPSAATEAAAAAANHAGHAAHHDESLASLRGYVATIRAAPRGSDLAQRTRATALRLARTAFVESASCCRLPPYKLDYLVADVLHPVLYPDDGAALMPLPDAGAADLRAIVEWLRAAHPKLDLRSSGSVTRVRNAWQAIVRALPPPPAT